MAFFGEGAANALGSGCKETISRATLHTNEARPGANGRASIRASIHTWAPTSILTLNMSAFGGKADIPDTPHQCLLMTQSGHTLAVCRF